MSLITDAVCRRLDALSLIQREARAASDKHGQYTALNDEMSPMVKLAILTEEVGEVANELCEGLEVGDHRGVMDVTALRTELAQVAAVCLLWIESTLTITDEDV